MPLDEKKAAMCLTACVSARSQIMVHLELSFLEEAMLLTKRITISEGRDAHIQNREPREHRRQSKCILPANVVAGIQAPARWKLLAVIKRLLT